MTRDYPIAAPAIVRKTPAGRILAAIPLRAIPAPGCQRWNRLLPIFTGGAA